MCTVSLVRRPGGFRLVCNRDERFTRPIALPPSARRMGSRLAVFPVDPVGGGTWVGVTETGMAVALVNRSSTHASQHSRPSSRGLVALRLLTCGSLDDACGVLSRLDWDQFLPFRVLLAHQRRVAIVTRDAAHLRVDIQSPDTPVMVTSSSLGDEIVEGPRRALFDEMLRRYDDSFAAQHAFHRHRWADRSHVSVLMRRADAATVSRTTIDVSGRGVDVDYEVTC